MGLWDFKVLFVIGFIAAVQSQCVVLESTTRLPSFIVPTNYQLYYTLPNPSSSAIVNSNSAPFLGNVSISLQIQQTTTCIALHSYKLNLTAITLRTDSALLAPASTQYLDAAQITILKFSQAITPQIAQLTISFSGNFNNQSATGFFLSDNVFDPSVLSHEKKVEAFKRRQEHKKEKKEFKLTAGQGKMYATQFESTAARYAYPCFDEPAFKAVFSLTATVTSDNTVSTNNITVLFNTPLASFSSGPGYTTFTFQPSPHPMSSYLVAIAVGEFEYLETMGEGGPFRIYTPPGASQYAAFALNVTKYVVSYFSEIWNFSYFSMMRKMDQISVPAIDEDAMENWGLLTYYPGFLLVDAANPKTPLPSLQIVALVVTHEISHQWFGDTVTTPWWNQIFLNEGYARLLQYVGVDYLFPEWEIYTQGGSNSYFNFAYLPALQADFMGLAPPIIDFSQTSGLPSIANADFGIIPYGKGAAINRMIVTYVSTDEWNRIMAYHLDTYKFTNPSILDLMDSYDTVLSTEISNMLLPYFVYPGFPVVTIKVNSDSLEISQAPVSQLGDFYPNPYWIAFNLQVTNAANKDSFTMEVEFTTHNTTLQLPSSGMWSVVADADFTSYLLFNYDNETWHQIISQITKIPDVNRQLIVQSQFMLLQMSFLNPQIASTTARALSINFESIDDVYPLYQTIFENWLSLSGLFIYNSTVNNAVLADLGASLTAITQRVGFSAQPGDDASARALRTLALYSGAYFGVQDIIDEEIAVYAKGSPLEEEQKKGVYWAVVRYTDFGYDSILQKLKNSSTSPSDKPLLLNALVAPPNVTLCQNTLDLITGNVNFTIPQQLNWISQMLHFNEECKDVAWAAYTSASQIGWQRNGISITPTIINGFDGLFATAKDLAAVKAFISSNEKFFTDAQTAAIFAKIQLNMQVVVKWG